MILENDLAEALPDTLTVRLNKEKLEDTFEKIEEAIEYLQNSKLYHMIELVKNLENVDLIAICGNSNCCGIREFYTWNTLTSKEIL